MIKLRAPEPEDLDLMYRIENDSSLWQYGGQNQPVSRYLLRQYIEQSSADIYRDGQLRLTIEDGGVAAGFLDLTNLSTIHQRAEVGIVVDSVAQRRGVGKQSLANLIEYVRQNIPLRQIYAVVGVENTAGNCLFRSAGFVQTCTLPGWITVNLQPQDAILWTYQL